MTRILIPASSPEDWKQFLAEPEKQWISGYSARSLAYCWHDSDGMPPEILSVLEQVPSLKNLKTIFAIPQHMVPLSGSGAWSIITFRCRSDVRHICQPDKRYSLTGLHLGMDTNLKRIS